MLAAARPLHWRQSLTAPHQVYSRVDVWNGDLSERLIEGLPIGQGSVNATLTSRVTRRLGLTLDAAWGLREELEPWGNQIIAWRGIDWGGGEIEAFAVFTGRITSMEVSAEACQVEALDRASDVVDAQFLRPYTVGTRRLHDEARRLIKEVLWEAEFGSFTVPDIVVPTLTYDTDRAQALDEITGAAGGLWYALANGSFVLRRLPWEVITDPVMTITDGPGGVIADCSYRLDRAEVHNAVRAVGERTDGDVPVEHVVYDVDPDSPWYYKGNFGFRPRTIRTQAAADVGLVRLIAESQLNRDRSLGETWTWTQPGDPTLELGDVVGIESAALNRSVRQAVVSFSLPLGAGLMTVQGRTQTHGEAVGQE